MVYYTRGWMYGNGFTAGGLPNTILADVLGSMRLKLENKLPPCIGCILVDS